MLILYFENSTFGDIMRWPGQVNFCLSSASRVGSGKMDSWSSVFHAMPLLTRLCALLTSFCLQFYCYRLLRRKGSITINTYKIKHIVAQTGTLLGLISWSVSECVGFNVPLDT